MKMPSCGLLTMRLSNLPWKTLQLFAHPSYVLQDICHPCYDQAWHGCTETSNRITKWPVTHGETVHVVMLGGLHTGMALWNTLADLLDGSGWTAALKETEVASSGKESFLKAAHLTRTKHSHQVTLMTLHNLQQEAFLLLDGPKDEDYAAAWRSDMQITRLPSLHISNIWFSILSFTTS